MKFARPRRRFIAGASALAAAVGLPRLSFAQSARKIVDDAGRSVDVPERATRVYAAGPPASVLVFAVAPDALLGWTTSFRAAERPYVAQKYVDLPTLGG